MLFTDFKIFISSYDSQLLQLTRLVTNSFETLWLLW